MRYLDSLITLGVSARFPVSDTAFRAVSADVNLCEGNLPRPPSESKENTVTMSRVCERGPTDEL